MAKTSFDYAKLSEALKISDTTKSEAGLAYRPPQIIRNSIRSKNIIVYRVDNKLVGWIEKYNIIGSAWGISTLYVDTNFRRKGIAGKLIKNACESLRKLEIYTATSNSHLGKILRSIRFRKVNINQIPKFILFFLALKRYYDPRTWNKLMSDTYYKLEYYYRPKQE